MSATLELARELIRRPSVTPDDAGCQDLMTERLVDSGFRIEPMPSGEVKNLWARRGDTGPVLCFAGHTDVVPAGAPERLDLAPLRADHPRRAPLRTRRRGHEGLTRGHGDGRGGLHPRAPGPPRIHRLPHHQRRGRRGGGRDGAGGGAAARAGRGGRLCTGRRALESCAARRHHQERPPGQPQRLSHRTRQAGSRGLPPSRRQPLPSRRAGAGRPVRRANGTRATHTSRPPACRSPT